MLFVVGLNYHQSALDVRELYAPGDQCKTLSKTLIDHPLIAEVFVLSTCNRAELYCLLNTKIGLDEMDQVYVSVRAQWEKVLQVPTDRSGDGAMFHIYGRSALEHFARVASGLEAMILGEPQILGQVKAAFRQAQDWGVAGVGMLNVINPLFELVKQVRTSTEIGYSSVSFASTIYRLATQIFSDVNTSQVLFIGAGEMIELVCRYFFHHKAQYIRVANRSLERIQPLISDYGVQAFTLEELPRLLCNADIVVSCTGSSNILVSRQDVELALKTRRSKPIFFADLAVPRDIDPRISEFENAFIYSVDDIHNVISKNQDQKLDAADKAHKLIEEGVEAILNLTLVQSIAPLIHQYRGDAEQIRVQLVVEARRKLIRGDDPHDVLEAMSRTLTNRLIHRPTKGLRSIAMQGEDGQVLLAKQLLGFQPGEH